MPNDAKHTDKRQQQEKAPNEHLRSNHAGVAPDGRGDLAVLHLLEEHDRLLPSQLPGESFHQRSVRVDVGRAISAGLELVEQLEGLVGYQKKKRCMVGTWARKIAMKSRDKGAGNNGWECSPSATWLSAVGHAITLLSSGEVSL